MSFEKIAAAGQVPAMIQFYYPTEKIFDLVSIITTYRSKMIKDSAGESMMDDIAVSQQEKDIVKNYLEQAIYDIFGEMLKITTGVTDPIFYDIDVTPSGGQAVKASGGKIEDKEAFNINILQTLDKKIENAIKYFILAEWYIVVNLEKDAELNKNAYREYLRKVKNLTFELRKPLMT